MQLRPVEACPVSVQLASAFGAGVLQMPLMSYGERSHARPCLQSPRPGTQIPFAGTLTWLFAHEPPHVVRLSHHHTVPFTHATPVSASVQTASTSVGVHASWPAGCVHVRIVADVCVQCSPG